MPRVKTSKWVADFETTTELDDCRVWSWGACDIDSGDYVSGLDMESFVAWASGFDNLIYFHNLKFDAEFLVSWLLSNGYKHTDQRTPAQEHFRILRTPLGIWYAVVITWYGGHKSDVNDSLKKLPMSVKQMAKAFDLDIAKGEIDYTKHRPVGYVPTLEEAEYQELDVRIVAQALKATIAQGAKGMTVGADALRSFKEIIGARQFGRRFPVLPLEVDAELRLAYRGGFTYVAERFQGRVLGRGRTYDVNSLYPAVMDKCFLPVGEPAIIDEFPRKNKDRLHILNLTISGKLKPDHIPCIQIKNSGMFSATAYLKEIEEPTDIWCTNVDLALWQDHYDLTIHAFNGGYEFRGAVGLFSRYIDHWMKIKETAKGALRTLAKLNLNSLYGKFATNPKHVSTIPRMGSDGLVKYDDGEETMDDPVYTAMGVFITAYARDITIRTAQQHYDEFAYADTDSLHLIGQGHPEGLNVHKTKLGAWKHEYDFSAAIFTRAKCYTELKAPEYVKHDEDCEPDCESCQWETHIAGMPKHIADRVRLHHHVEGYEFGGKLTPKRVPGGVVLRDTTFKLKPHAMW